MSQYGDYKDEMVDENVNDEWLDLLSASGTLQGSPSPVAEFLQQLQSLGDALPEEAVITRHLAMLSDEAAMIPVVDPVGRGSTGPLVGRRRVAFGTLMSGFVLNALIGTAAFAAVGTGAAVAADSASPGDVLYGLDRAFEKVGINDGRAAERIEEAMALVDRGQHSRAMETLEEAIDDLADDTANASALKALENASDRVAKVRTTDSSGYQDTQGFRDQVAGLVGLIATEVEHGTVDGVLISETARGFSDSARDFAENRSSGTDGGLPTGPDTSPDKRPEAPRGQSQKPDAPGKPDQS
jgi:hypothetical protein